MAIDAHTGFDFDHAAGTMTRDEQQQADNSLLVQFYTHPMLDLLLTEGGLIHKKHPRVAELRELGFELKEYSEDDKHFVVEPLERPFYREVEFIRIMKPGDRNTVIERPVEKEDKLRFGRRYSDWKEGRQTDGAVGLPLAELPFLTAAQREEFKFFGIHTAEQLVAMSDSVAQKFMGINVLRQRVQHYLDGKNSPAAAISSLAREMETKNAELEAQRQAIAELQAQLALLGAVREAPRAEPVEPQPQRSQRR